MNIHEGFQIGTRVKIDDTANEYRFHGKHGVVIDHWNFYQSKVLCDDGSVWVGNRFCLSQSQRPTKYSPDQWESAALLAGHTFDISSIPNIKSRPLAGNTAVGWTLCQQKGF